MNQEADDFREEQETDDFSEEPAKDPEMAPTDTAGEADVEKDQQITEAQSEIPEDTADESQDGLGENKAGEDAASIDKPREGKSGRVHTVPTMSQAGYRRRKDETAVFLRDLRQWLHKREEDQNPELAHERVWERDEPPETTAPIQPEVPTESPSPEPTEAQGETPAPEARVPEIEPSQVEEGTPISEAAASEPRTLGDAIEGAAVDAAIEADRYIGLAIDEAIYAAVDEAVNYAENALGQIESLGEVATDVARDTANGIQRVGDATTRVVKDAAFSAGDAMSPVTRAYRALREAAMDAARDEARRAVDSVEDYARAFPESAARSAEILRDAISAHVRMRPLREYYRDRSQERDEEAEDTQDER